jgi:Protein of unknown function (DUF3105)
MTDPATRRRLVIAIPLAAILLAVAGWSWQRSENPAPSSAMTGTGESRDSGCGPVLREPAAGAGAHLDGEPIVYPAAPPSFGDHRSRWEVRAHSFYGVEDRPDIAVLVHNLEHGYNILWYDQTVIDDTEALDRVREIARRYASLDGERDPATAFIAAPWTTQDGADFPHGMNYALTHWYADPTDRTGSRADERGVTQYCADVSAEIVQQWMDAYPLTDAPEGFPDLM